jgi:hypothetical protein
MIGTSGEKDLHDFYFAIQCLFLAHRVSWRDAAKCLDLKADRK